MKRFHYLNIALFLVCSYASIAQENIFLKREYWKNNPTVTQVKKDIEAGNNPTELNPNAFDAVVYALLEKADNATVEYLLSLEGNDVNKRTHDGRTYIFWAAYKDNLEMMNYLVKKGAKTGLIDSHGYSLLNFAAVTGQQNTALYDFCLAHGSDPKTEKNHDGANALLLVAPFFKDEKLIDYFISKGVDVHSTDTNGNGLFNYAAKQGSKKVFDMLIKRGVAYKNPTKDNGNAFIFASRGTRRSENNLETYKYLETLGIQPNVVTDQGFTPLHALAYKNKDLDIFSYFIKKGVDVNQPDMNGNTPFSNAVYRNSLESIVFLSKHVANINQNNKKGITPLMRAVQNNDINVVNFLIGKGGDVFAKDTDGNSIAYYLLKSYDERTIEDFDAKVKILKDKGVDFTEAQAEGNTLWHLAAKENNLKLLGKLTSLHIPINAKNSEGVTALHIAAMKATNIEVLKFLLSRGADKKVKTDFDESVLDLAQENELLQKQQLQLNFLK